jgi:hypothetical protein
LQAAEAEAKVSVEAVEQVDTRHQLEQLEAAEQLFLL